MKICSLAVIGDGSVDKSTISNAFKNDGFQLQTIGVEFFEKQLIVRNNEIISLRVWDIGGQSIHSKNLSDYIQYVDGILLVYDVSNRDSFNNLTDWLINTRKYNSTEHISLIGNKIDLISLRQVSKKDHQNFLVENNIKDDCFCSAKTGENVLKLFYRFASAIVGIHLSPYELSSYDKHQRVDAPQVPVREEARKEGTKKEDIPKWTCEIMNFVTNIIADLPPIKERLKKQRSVQQLNNPLPLDCASGANLLQTQEIVSIGPIVHEFKNLVINCANSNAQDKSIFCVAASSGTGKTHLAYAVGNSITMILIRIKNTLALTDPWSSLTKLLAPLHHQEMERGDINHNPEKALQLIKLLIYCYVESTLEALSYAKEHFGCDLQTLREISLRFNRNGRGEGIVKQRFDMKSLEMMKLESFEDRKSFLREIRSNLQDKFTILSREGSSHETLLICFDEIQELLQLFPNLFIRFSQYQEGSDTTEFDDVHSRGLFYGVACAMLSLTRNMQNVVMYMTGTSLSISKLYAEKGISLSLLRGSLSQISLSSSVLTAKDMKYLIQYYWVVSDEIFTAQIMQGLQIYVGRPYFFVEHIFRAIHTLTMNESITESSLLALLESQEKSVRRVIRLRIDKYFVTDNHAIGGLGDRTRVSLIPALVKAIICGDGTISLNEEEDISKAITQGIILASAVDVGEQMTCNIRETEPLVFDELKNYLGQQPRDRLLQLLLNQIRHASGHQAEQVFTYWISLTVFLYKSTHECEGMPLGELLYPLFDGEQQKDFPLARLNEFECRATQVVDLRNASLPDVLVTTPSHSLDHYRDRIYYGIDTSSGVDIVMVVKDNEMGIFKLVVFQSKNDRSITLQEAILTLSPGTQYLTEAERKLVTGCVESLDNRISGPGTVRWDKWYRFCKRHDQSIGNHWIRIILVSRKVSQKVHEYLSQKQYLQRLEEKITDQYWTMFARAEKKKKRTDRYQRAKRYAESSPIVCLTLSSPHWLSETVRQSFVNINEQDGGMSLPSTKMSRTIFLPVPIEDARERLINIPMV